MTVFAVQRQIRFNPETKQTEDRFTTISKAEKWGKVQYILSPNSHPFEPETVLGTLHESLSGFENSDYLILVGNPILMGLATAIAAYYNEGAVNFLQWSPRDNDYVVVSTEIF